MFVKNFLGKGTFIFKPLQQCGTLPTRDTPSLAPSWLGLGAFCPPISKIMDHPVHRAVESALSSFRQPHPVHSPPGSRSSISCRRSCVMSDISTFRRRWY